MPTCQSHKHPVLWDYLYLRAVLQNNGCCTSSQWKIYKELSFREALHLKGARFTLLVFEALLPMLAMFTMRTSFHACFIASCVEMGVSDKPLARGDRGTIQAQMIQEPYKGGKEIVRLRKILKNIFHFISLENQSIPRFQKTKPKQNQKTRQCRWHQAESSSMKAASK